MGSTECLSSSDHFSHPMCLVLLASSLFKPALQRQLRPSQHKEKAISSITFNQSTGARRVYFIPESVSPFPSSLLSSSSDIFTSPGPTLINVRQSSANMPRLFSFSLSLVEGEGATIHWTDNLLRAGAKSNWTDHRQREGWWTY